MDQQERQQREKVKRLSLDLVLTRRVAQHLLHVDASQFERVSIVASNGVVTLTGWVHTDRLRRFAGDAARRLSGVVDVVNELKVDEVGAALAQAQQRYTWQGMQRFALSHAVILVALLIGLSQAVQVAWALLPNDEEKSPVDAHLVEWQVFQDKKPATGAKVVFHLTSVPETEVFVPRPVGYVDATGKLILKTFQPGDGAPVGEYTVTLVRQLPVISGEETVDGPNLLPGEFARPATSPVKIRIQPGVNTLPPLQITTTQ